MCGRIIQASGPLRYQLVDGLEVPDSRLSNIPRRYNGAPTEELLVIRQNHATGERSLDLLKWGLVPSWSSDPKGGPKPINAMAETVIAKELKHPQGHRVHIKYMGPGFVVDIASLLPRQTGNPRAVDEHVDSDTLELCCCLPDAFRIGH